MLHGLLGSAAQWDGEAARLACDRNCWQLELPGISASDRCRDQSLPGLVDWFEQAVREHEWHSFDLLGSSWGGLLALAFACVSPLRARLRRLVLVAPAHPLWMPCRRQRWMMTAWGTRCGAFLGARVPANVHRALLAGMYGNPSRLDAQSVERYGATLRRAGLGAAMAATTRHWRRDQRWLRPALPQLTAPTLLVWGDRDRVVPASTAPALASALPGSRLAVLAGLGHLPFAEDPAAFHAIVGPFLA